MKKPEFSKLIFCVDTILTISVTIFGCVLMWRTADLSALPTLLSLAFGAYATTTGFYFWKARKENEIKLLKANNIKIERRDITGKTEDEYTENQIDVPYDGTEGTSRYE